MMKMHIFRKYLNCKTCLFEFFKKAFANMGYVTLDQALFFRLNYKTYKQKNKVGITDLILKNILHKKCSFYCYCSYFFPEYMYFFF